MGEPMAISGWPAILSFLLGNRQPPFSHLFLYHLYNLAHLNFFFPEQSRRRSASASTTRCYLSACRLSAAPSLVKVVVVVVDLLFWSFLRKQMIVMMMSQLQQPQQQISSKLTVSHFLPVALVARNTFSYIFYPFLPSLASL